MALLDEIQRSWGALEENESALQNQVDLDLDLQLNAVEWKLVSHGEERAALNSQINTLRSHLESLRGDHETALRSVNSLKQDLAERTQKVEQVNRELSQVEL